MPREIVSNEIASNKIKARRTAEIMGISREWYIKMENNPYSIPVDRLYQIADALKCKVSLFILP